MACEAGTLREAGRAATRQAGPGAKIDAKMAPDAVIRTINAPFCYTVGDR